MTNKLTEIADQAMLDRLKDPRYFIERFFWIVDKSRKKVPFVFNHPQDFYYKAMTKADLILKSRKEGFSTLIEALWLHSCMFFENECAVTMAQNEDEMKVHKGRIDFFLETMGLADIPFKVNIDTQNQKEIYFPDTNSYYWVGSAGSRSFGRSRDITKFHSTETAHYEDQTVLTGVINACTTDARMVYETTANGYGEVFNLLWTEATDRQSLSVWKPHFFGWHQDPTNKITPDPLFRLSQDERDLQKQYNLSIEQMAWRRKKYSEQPDKQKFPQEYPINPEEAFISSGRNIFSIHDLKQMLDRCTDPVATIDLIDNKVRVEPIFNENGKFHIWKMPDKRKSYFISADVAAGVPNGAWSVGRVFDRSTQEVVAQIRIRENPGSFGEDLVLLGMFYNWAILAPEINNVGYGTIQAIKEANYPHILRETDLWDEANKDKLGFPTTEKTKNLIISNMSMAIERKTYFDPSKISVQEAMRAVRNEAGKMVALSGYTDCIMATAIGLFCLKFFALDDTYRKTARNDEAMFITSIVGPAKRTFGRFLNRRK